MQNGGYIERDFTFEDGKFYDVICGGKIKGTGQVCEYSDAEYEFGKENLQKMPSAFVEKIRKQLKNTETYLAQTSMQQENRESLLKKKIRLQGVLDGVIK